MAAISLLAFGIILLRPSELNLEDNSSLKLIQRFGYTVMRHYQNKTRNYLNYDDDYG